MLIRLPFILRCRRIPQVSPQRQSSVSVMSTDDGVVVLVPFPEPARLGGLVSAAHTAALDALNLAAGASFSRPGIASPYNPDGSLQVAFPELLHVRRRPSCGSISHAAHVVPDAATALSASAAALAAARFTSAGCVVSPGQIHLGSKSSEPGADTQPAGQPHETACIAAPGAQHGIISVPAATARTTRAATRSGGVAGALARMRREASDPVA